MATTVTKDNLFSESRNNVVDLLKENLSDPITSSAQYRKFIYSRRPDVKAGDFKGYPYVIVYNTDIDKNEQGTLNMKSKMVTFNMEIEVITSDRDCNNREGLGSTQMDTICNSISAIFDNVTNRNTLQANGMFFGTLTSSPVTTESIHNQLVYTRSMMYSFKSKMRLSS